MKIGVGVLDMHWVIIYMLPIIVLGAAKVSDNKKLGPKTRTFRPRLWSLYGKGYIATDRLEDQLLEDGGEVLLKAVYDEKVEGEPTIVYGVFYKTESGEFYDVMNQRLGMLRTYATANAAIAFINGFAERCGPQYLDVTLPALRDDLAIKPGDLR